MPGTGRVAGKIAVVSGGSRGIGAASARLLVAEGAKVCIADLNDAEGEALAKELGPDVAHYAHLDVRSAENWDSVINGCSEIFGPPSILVHSAGIMKVAPIATATEEDFRNVLDVNVIGPFLGTKAAIAPMQRAGKGSIVILTSGAGLRAQAGMPQYGASKAANAMLARVAALELGPLGIRVNAIAPGAIDTAMSNGPEFEGVDRTEWFRDLPIPRIGEVDDVSPAVLFLASDESRYVTGSVLAVDGGAQY
jgi:3alpha(or 20beta)-hydroxysteroid dehydrogenase